MLIEFKNMTRSIAEVAREYQKTLSENAPVDTGRLRDSINVIASKDGFELYAVDYIYYVRTNNTAFNTARSLFIDNKFTNITSDEVKVEIPTEKITEGFMEDIDTWLSKTI